jgi:putative inorganic carbon (HCO3(-)) transporter
VLRLVFAVAFILFGAAQSLRGAFYGLLYYLAIAYFRPELWVWSDSLQSLNLSFIVGIYVLVATLMSREKIALTLPVALIAVFCIHGLMGTLLSPYSDWCFLWWKGFAKVSLVAILIISLVNTEERLRLTFIVIAFALGFEGAKQGWAYVVMNPGEPNANGLEILGDNNGVAVGMLMLSSVLLALFQTSIKKSHKFTYGGLVVGTLFRSLTTYSRGGLLAFGAMCFMYWSRSRRRILTGVLIGTLGVGLLALLPQSYWDRMQTIGATEENRDSSAASRLHFWNVAREMAFRNPIFGVGNTGFQAAYNDYDTSGGAFGRNRAVHSTWFGVLADQGYVGFIMFVSLLGWAFFTNGRVRRRTRGVAGREALFAYAGALQTALVTAAVGGTFLSYHYVEILWHFIALSFALSGIAARSLAEQPPVVEIEEPLMHPAFQGAARTA